MSTYLTAKLKLPVPNDDDPFQQGARRIRELGEAIDASTGAAWVALALASGWTTQAGFIVPAYRVLNGVCQLRGTVRYAASNVPTSTNIFNAPVPAGAPADSAAVYLSAVLQQSTDGTLLNMRVLINPRSDGICRCLNRNDAGSSNQPGNLVHLDGLSYSIA